MTLTLLQLVQSAADELGIPQPAQVIGAQDDTSRQLLALAIREGKEFSQLANKNGGWQDLHVEYIFTTNAVPTTTGDLTLGSKIITNIPSTAGIAGETWTVTGNGIAYQAKVVSVDGPTQVTIDQAATETLTGVSLAFGQAAYDIPSDLEYFLDKTFWDGSYRWQLLGPLEAQEKNVIKYGISPVGPRRRFWILKDKLWINPTPTNTTDIIAYDYLSNAWSLSPDGLDQNTWVSDLDTYKLDDDCFILGLKYRFLRAKGLDYSEEYRTYQDACFRVMARDGAGRDLPTNAQSTGINLLSNANIPDTGFGQ